MSGLAIFGGGYLAGVFAFVGGCGYFYPDDDYDDGIGFISAALVWPISIWIVLGILWFNYIRSLGRKRISQKKLRVAVREKETKLLEARLEELDRELALQSKEVV